MKQRKANKSVNTTDKQEQYEVPGDYFRLMAEDGKAIRVMTVVKHCINVTANRNRNGYSK